MDKVWTIGYFLMLVALVGVLMFFGALIGYSWRKKDDHDDTIARVRRVINRIKAVKEIQGAPDRSEVDRWLTELELIVTDENRP